MQRFILGWVSCLLVSLVLALFVIAGFAYGDHNSVEINACWKIRNGDLRLATLDSNGVLRCSANEQAIKWAVEGPQGPPGEAMELEPVSCDDTRSIGCCAIVGESP